MIFRGHKTLLAALAATTALTAMGSGAWAQAAAASEGAPSAGQPSPTPDPAASPTAATPPANDATTSNAAAKGPATLSEIVVTADRKNSYSADYVQAGSFRGARALDTPLTISVVPREVLESQQAQSLLDALKNTAGVTQDQTSTVVYSNIAIRGINVDNRENYRLNGSLPILNLTDLPLEDKDRVEALKGASALYYGFTTPSGIINLVMKRPTAQPYLEADAFGNDHGEVGAHVDIGGTYGMFGARVNAVYADVDSGQQFTYGHRSLLSGAFDFKPTNRLTISFDAEHMEKSVNEPGVYRFTSIPASTLNNLYPSVSLPQLQDPSKNIGQNWALNRTMENNVLGHVEYKLSDAWVVTLDGGDSYLTRDRHFNTINPINLTTGAGQATISLQHSYLENKNIRGEIAGTFYTGPFLHEILFGAADNYKTQFAPTSDIADCKGGVALNATGGLASTSPASCATNFFNPTQFPATPFPNQVQSSPGGDTTFISDIGYYVFDRISYNKWLTVLGGIRYSDYTEGDAITGVNTFHATPTAYSWGVVLKPQPWASIYGTYIEGLETTPLAPTTAANPGAQLPPTTSTQYEGGLKLEPIRGLLFQAAYFDITRGANFVNGSNVYVQDGTYEYRGEEFSLTGEINRNVSIYASALLLDARQVTGSPTLFTYKSGGATFTNTSIAPPAGVTPTSISPTTVGKVVENTPRVTFSVAGEYRFVNWVPGLSVNGAVYYVDRRALNALNQAFAPGYTTVNLGAAYVTRLYDHQTTFRINADNVGNRRYWDSTGGSLLSQAPPGDVRFQVSSKF
ncbi:TonB-dependent siderophore receptor [Caulobacter sp. S45]|uniref:TonB-dependent siderophore receptor n=1 Tax=Caulobacter sp. S45 TaxID=1641861 RepID=UPI00131EA7FA|nr:TonB-dependent receptor [Caulobacter sp. S45]